MDLSSPRVKNEEKLAICKKNFFMGLALLPWLWFINGVWFFREAFFKEPFDQQPMIRRFEIAQTHFVLDGWRIALSR